MSGSSECSDWGLRTFLAVVVVLWALTPAQEEKQTPMVGWVRPEKFGIEVKIPFRGTRVVQLGLRQDGVCMWRLLPEDGK